MTDLLQALDAIKSRWMVGGTAIEQMPPEFRGALDGTDSPELALLAITAQAGLIALRPAPAGELSPFPALPKLDLPTLPDPLRATFRRFFSLQKISAEQADLLLHFIAGRGYTVHPSDHMPSRFELLPSCYGPWESWSEQETRMRPDEGLTEQSWDDYLPAERLHSLSELRRSDPAAARTLIEAKAEGLAADQRLRVIGALETGLSPEDAAYLEGLRQSDRSGKVQALATALLARLGVVPEEGESARELADFHEVGKKGLINRRTAVSARKLKTGAQKTRRSELYEIVSLPGFAAALALSPETLISSWQFGNSQDDAAFCAMVGRTGSQAVVLALADRILSESSAFTGALNPLLERMTAEERWQRLPAVLKKEPDSLVTALRFAEGNLGRLGMNTLAQAPRLKSLVKTVKAVAEGEAKNAQTAALQTELFQLGLIADQAAARDLVQTITEAGMSRADAALLMLQFNAALTPGDPS